MITEIIVVVLALLSLIPEFVVCKRYGRKFLGTKGQYPYCKDEEEQ